MCFELHRSSLPTATSIPALGSTLEESDMSERRKVVRQTVVIALAACSLIGFSSTWALAQETKSATGFEQKTYVYEPWIKGKFSEVVTVKNPGKWIFLAGIGPESEGDGKILHPGDFYKQCKYAYYRIKKLLGMHGATLKNVVFATTYVTDIRYIGASGKCRSEEYGEAGAELPPGATVGVNSFAWPDMLIEIAVTAAVEK
jgi:enamine deaminase RidA (YjgF/YER057c/UK114 family)